MAVRSLPWLLAIIGLAFALVATDLAGWAVVALWLLVLAAIWLIKPLTRANRGLRIALALASLPVLVLIATFFGLYLIPAAAAWLLTELIWPTPATRQADQSKSG